MFHDDYGGLLHFVARVRVRNELSLSLGKKTKEPNDYIYVSRSLCFKYLPVFLSKLFVLCKNERLDKEGNSLKKTKLLCVTRD